MNDVKILTMPTTITRDANGNSGLYFEGAL